MRRVNIQDTAPMEDKELIPSIAGTITNLYPQEEKTGKYPGTYQNGRIQDSTGESFIRFEDHEDLSHLKGKEVVIECWSGDKGLSGVYKNVYNDKHSIRVTKTGSVTPQGAGESSGAGEPTQQSSPAPKTSPAPTQSRTGTPSELTEMQVKKNLNQLANFDLQCGVAADYARHKMKERGIEMTAEEFQARWSSYFITGTREGWHRAFPTGEYEWPDKKVKAAPEQSDEPVTGNPF